MTALPNILVTQARNPDPNPAGNVYDGYWWMDRIRLREAWDVTTGSPDIPVAVVDVGVALDCGHFDGKVIRLGLRCRKPDGEVYFIDQINSANECEAHLPGEHGTAVAAILASRGDDGRGGADFIEAMVLLAVISLVLFALADSVLRPWVVPVF